MKICAVICEFNPFHNGHLYLLEQARKLSGCDRLICIMSGSFTQRGEICISDRFSRAYHAVSGGADCVIELPTAFAVAPAEIFADGAVKILSSIPEVTTITFGCEDDSVDFIKTAELLSDENNEFKTALENELKKGNSYVKSYAKAFENSGGSGEFLSGPNNILGIEYAKAVLRRNPNIKLLPVKRIGAQYNDGKIKDNYSSASAIRNNLNSDLVKNNVPDYVFEELKNCNVPNDNFRRIAAFGLFNTTADKLKKIFGCGEGLENKLVNCAGKSYQSVISECTTKRYPSSRISRILCANLLGLYEDECKIFLNEKLYIRPLAIKDECASDILSSLSKSEFPLITRGRERKNLTEIAGYCLSIDEKAAKLRNFIAEIN